ncbi:PLD nuclease N-terminal domain-containing protein [Spirosoma humi]
MPSPDTSLVLWQIGVVTQLPGTAYALMQIYRQSLPPGRKTAWCLVILFIPLGWVIYLLFRKQIESARS